MPGFSTYAQLTLVTCSVDSVNLIVFNFDYDLPLSAYIVFDGSPMVLDGHSLFSLVLFRDSSYSKFEYPAHLSSDGYELVVVTRVNIFDSYRVMRVGIIFTMSDS